MSQQHTPEPIAYRLTNTSYRNPRFEYFTTKEEAESRKFEFNRSVDDGGLYNITPLWGPEYVKQLERESSACDMVAELTKQRDMLLEALEYAHEQLVREAERNSTDVRRAKLMHAIHLSEEAIASVKETK